MNKHNSSVRYDRRTVGDWVRKARKGEIALTDFQRSYVWPSDKAEKYIKAIIDGKPVGVFLILEKADEPQFKPRQFNKIQASLHSVSELILDGQQRMTSLLQALDGASERKYFIKIQDLSSNNLEVLDIINFDRDTIREKEFRNPITAYEANLVPLDILWGEYDDHGLSLLSYWCIKVAKTLGTFESRVLENKIKNFFEEYFFRRDIWYCCLPKTMDRTTATEIFVETNTSSVRIKRFDIEVASVRGVHDENLRNSISEACELSENSVFRHYFKEDPEDLIPDIGEWMLKVACLRADRAPREVNYKEALNELLKKKEKDQYPDMERIFKDLAWSLDYVSEFGASTRRTIPSWPPLHVLAAIRPMYKQIKDPSKVNTARALISAYYWRCLFSNRYDVHANDRLHQDFRALQKALMEIEKKGEWSAELPAFEDKDHPLCTADDMIRHTPWIGKQSRLGRALVSLVMSKNPRDWITGESLTPNRIRELERNGNLDRHHVFSRYALKKAEVSYEIIQNGLNGVFLDRRTNRKLSKEPPEIYLKKIVENQKLDEKELRLRIEDHLVPYDQMKSVGKIEKRYEKYLMQRAKCINEQINSLGRISK